MMRKQASGDRCNRRRETECTDFDGRGVEADEARSDFVVTHRAHFEPNLRALQDHDQQQDAGCPGPDVTIRDMLHAVEAGGASHRVEIEEEAADHLAKSERRHRQIYSFQPQCRETDDHADQTCRAGRDHQRRGQGDACRYSQIGCQIGADTHEAGISERQLTGREDNVNAQRAKRENADISQQTGVIGRHHTRCP